MTSKEEIKRMVCESERKEALEIFNSGYKEGYNKAKKEDLEHLNTGLNFTPKCNVCEFILDNIETTKEQIRLEVSEEDE